MFPLPEYPEGHRMFKLKPDQRSSSSPGAAASVRATPAQSKTIDLAKASFPDFRHRVPALEAGAHGGRLGGTPELPAHSLGRMARRLNFLTKQVISMHHELGKMSKAFKNSGLAAATSDSARGYEEGLAKSERRAPIPNAA